MALAMVLNMRQYTILVYGQLSFSIWHKKAIYGNGFLDEENN
jgi:hypothetical protein